MDGQRDKQRYDLLIEQCSNSIQHYERIEDWLTTIQQSGFDADTIAEIRSFAREERVSAITRQVHDNLSIQEGNQDEAFRPVLDILAELNLHDESVYDSVLLACDTARPEDLETALATVKLCQSRAEQGLRMVPDILARQQRREIDAAAVHGALKGGAIGAAIGAVVGFVSCIAVTLGPPTIDDGRNTFVACVFITCALGAVIGYLRKRKPVSNN